MTDIERPPSDFGRLLRLWRMHARMSQLDLSVESGVSQRHLSFIETGRARPRAEVIGRLSEALAIPLRDRNRLFVAAGLPPHYPEVGLGHGSLAPFRAAIHRILTAHEPYPAFVLDRWWDVVTVNAAAERLFPGARDGIPNAVETFLAPDGLREMVVNFPEVAAMYLRRLRSEVAEASDPRLHRLLARAQDLLADVSLPDAPDGGDLVICPRLRVGDQVIGTVTMVARFGATRAVLLDELRVELIFPADDAADAWFRSQA